MSIFFSVLGVAVLLIIFFNKAGGGNESVNHHRKDYNYPEDSNYSVLKKLFFYPRSRYFDVVHAQKIEKVFGVLIESECTFGHKVIFATYINGYAGFYRNRGGGCLGGKYYYEGDPTVQHDVERVIGRNGSVSDFLSKEITDKATAFTILANDYLQFSVLNNGWNNRQGVVTIWLMTDEGPYQWQVQQTELYQSEFKDLAFAANDIISDLWNSEECLREDPFHSCGLKL
jgi:hypothetical protein